MKRVSIFVHGLQEINTSVVEAAINAAGLDICDFCFVDQNSGSLDLAVSDTAEELNTSMKDYKIRMEMLGLFLKQLKPKDP